MSSVKLAGPGLPGTRDYAGDHIVVPAEWLPGVSLESCLVFGVVKVESQGAGSVLVSSKGFLLGFWACRQETESVHTSVSTARLLASCNSWPLATIPL